MAGWDPDWFGQGVRCNTGEVVKLLPVSTFDYAQSIRMAQETIPYVMMEVAETPKGSGTGGRIHPVETFTAGAT